MHHLIWFREDLRITDNTALYYACKSAKESVIAIYLITPEVWKAHDMAFCRVDFLLRGLRALSSELIALHIPLIVEVVLKTQDIPILMQHFCQTHEISNVYFNQQYEVDEIERDQNVEKTLAAAQIQVFSFHDQTILPPDIVKTKTQQNYTVFTPYKRTWLASWIDTGAKKILPKPSMQKLIKLNPSEIPLEIAGFENIIDPTLWPAGETAARKRLHQFLKSAIKSYHIQRDIPCSDGTSKLSPYLSAGMISPRECFINAWHLKENSSDKDKEGIETWINELIWRDFYKQILISFPRISRHKPFKLNTQSIIWNADESLFNAWKTGQTGFPIIDAAMRQLNQIGWMHNRLRMLTAMFLSKLMLLDWRLGEKYFMQHLIDGDLAANNGGWQWSSSTGTDSVPYFRIFNPYTQSQKFDPEGIFIRHYCPELSALDNKILHNPYAFPDKIPSQLKYPKPVLDYTIARKKALDTFKRID